MAEKLKRVPSTVVIGPHGRMVTRGYTEIGGVRIYDDQVQVGAQGHFVSPGWIEPVNPAASEPRDER